MSGSEDRVKRLHSGWKAFEKKIKRNQEKILFLDFDGTLTPICKTPEAVRLDPRMHRVIEKIAMNRSFRVVIVSGRTLADLKEYFRMKRVMLVGNHGLEAYPSSGLSRAARKARRKKKSIGTMAMKLQNLFTGWAGVRLENKTYTLSLHFRNIDTERLELFQGVIDFYRKETANLPLTWRPGKKVWEVRPTGYFGKADVASYFLKKYPKAYPIAIGDDDSDEEMFRAIALRGAAIRVGCSIRSSAGYCVQSPQELRYFLEALSQG